MIAGAALGDPDVGAGGNPSRLGTALFDLCCQDHPSAGVN